MKKSCLFLLLLVTVASCSKDPGVEIVIPLERTVLLYVALDNNLSGEFSELRSSILEGWDNLNIENGALVVFADTRGSEKPLLMRVEKVKGKAVFDTLWTYSNDNSASSELLEQVIRDTKDVAPAKSYGMLLFSHATGWLPAGAYSSPTGWSPPTANNNSKVGSRSIFEDRGQEMELADFVAAIPDGTFEFIASEMCFMSSVETAYALRNKTKYLLAAATEVLSPGFEPIYRTSLGLLYKTKPDLEGFAQEFFDYFDQVKGHPFIRSATISIVKTSEMQALADFTREVAPSLTQDQIDVVQHFDRIPPRSSSFPYIFFDYRDYIAQVSTDAQLTELDVLLDKAVIFKRSTPKLINIYIPKHSGLSVYIPQGGLPRLNEAYEGTDWYKATVK